MDVLLTWAEMTTVLLLSKLSLISDDIRRLWKGFLRIGNHLPSSPNHGVNTNFQQRMSFFISQTERTHVAPCRESTLRKHLLLKDNSILILLICIYCVCVCVYMLCHKIHSKWGGQLVGVGSHCRVVSVGKAWLASAEPYHWPLKIFYSLQWQLLH